MESRKKQKSRSGRRGGAARARNYHRAQQSRSARAFAESQPAAAIPDHPLIHAGSAELIETDAALAEVLDHLRAAGSFAYDTEFIGEVSYFPKLCLVQVATHERVALLDPLMGIDLTPFWELVAEPAVCKVVHAGQQDLEPVYRHLGRPAANIFDVQVAAGFVDLPYPMSLKSLLQELFDVSLGKGLTFTQWDERPLSRVHQRYAADDVRYLPAARAHLEEHLRRAGRLEWAWEECTALTHPGLYRFDPETQYVRMQRTYSLRPRHLAALRELIKLRDRVAREQDAPPRTVLKDDVLVRLARESITQAGDLNGVRGLPRPFIREHGAAILQALGQGQAAAEAPHSARDDESPTERLEIDRLAALATTYCLGQGVDPGLTFTRQDIAHFYTTQGRRRRPAAESRLRRGWRNEMLGEWLGEFLRGSKCVQIGWSNRRLQSRLLQTDAEEE